MRSLVASTRRILDRRLNRDSRRPLAVALSGGGDSLALTLIADAWAQEAGRDLLVLTVDHRIQAQSRDWTEACAGVAQRLGRRFRALRWEGAKPVTGLPAAARAARHRLLAEAAREAGARVILMGHTADDLAEAAAMRAAGATTPDPREWAPSPVWPEGRGLFLLRPMLAVRRSAIREWLGARGESWIEDPANADPRYARSRARLAGAGVGGVRSDPPALALAARASEWAGMIRVARGDVRAASLADVSRFVAIAAVSAGGGERRPATSRIARAASVLRGPDPFVASLAGARFEGDEADVRIFREAGEVSRGGLPTMRLAAGRAVIWDGRFELAAERDGFEVRRLSGLARGLPDEQQRALRGLPPAARGGLPALVDPDGGVTCPALSGAAVSLVGERFRAAAGLIDREPD